MHNTHTSYSYKYPCECTARYNEPGGWAHAPLNPEIMSYELWAHYENEGRGAFYTEAGHLLKQILRDNDGAYQAYSKADNVSLLEPKSLRDFADVCAKKGEFFLSAELLERWARSLTPPQVISALIDVALFEVSQLNRTDRAISLLQQALDIQPDNWNVLHTLSHLLESDEDWPQAAIIYEKMGDLSSGGIASHYY